jgi:hypothetical protein
LRGFDAESQNRTGDTAIFSRVLYQLSYLGEIVMEFYMLVKALSSKSGMFDGMFDRNCVSIKMKVSKD